MARWDVAIPLASLLSDVGLLFIHKTDNKQIIGELEKMKSGGKMVQVKEAFDALRAKGYDDEVRFLQAVYKLPADVFKHVLTGLKAIATIDVAQRDNFILAIASMGSEAERRKALYSLVTNAMNGTNFDADIFVSTADTLGLLSPDAEGKLGAKLDELYEKIKSGISWAERAYNRLTDFWARWSIPIVLVHAIYVIAIVMLVVNQNYLIASVLSLLLLVEGFAVSSILAALAGGSQSAFIKNTARSICASIFYFLSLPMFALFGWILLITFFSPAGVQLWVWIVTYFAVVLIIGSNNAIAQKPVDPKIARKVTIVTLSIIGGLIVFGILGTGWTSASNALSGTPLAKAYDKAATSVQEVFIPDASYYYTNQRVACYALTSSNEKARTGTFNPMGNIKPNLQLMASQKVLTSLTTTTGVILIEVVVPDAAGSHMNGTHVWVEEKNLLSQKAWDTYEAVKELRDVSFLAGTTITFNNKLGREYVNLPLVTTHRTTYRDVRVGTTTETLKYDTEFQVTLTRREWRLNLFEIK